MTKEQIMIFDSKLEKICAEDIVYFEGFKDCIQFLVNVVFPVAERGAYDMKDHVMRYPFTRLLYNMKDALEEKLVDELFRRMDQTIEGYEDKYLMKEEEEPEESLDDYLIDTDDIPDPEWMFCDDDCRHCTVAECRVRTEDCMDAGSFLPDSSIDFMNIGGNEDD